jgi:hypothetical protein
VTQTRDVVPALIPIVKGPTIDLKALGLLDIDLVKPLILRIEYSTTLPNLMSMTVHFIAIGLMVAFFSFGGSTHLSIFNNLIVWSYIIPRHFNLAYKLPSLELKPMMWCLL